MIQKLIVMNVLHHDYDLYERIYRKLGFLDGQGECLYRNIN